MQKYSSLLPAGSWAQAPGAILFPEPWVCVWMAASPLLPCAAGRSSHHTLSVRRGFWLELTDPSQVQTEQSYLQGFHFLAPLALPSISIHRKPVGSPDLGFSTPSQISLICTSVCCCIHSFPMHRHTHKSPICAELSDVDSVTCKDPPAQTQRVLHLFSQHFRCSLVFFSPSTTQWFPNSSLAIHKLIHNNEYHILFPLGSFLFLRYISSWPTLTLALPFYASDQKWLQLSGTAFTLSPASSASSSEHGQFLWLILPSHYYASTFKPISSIVLVLIPWVLHVAGIEDSPSIFSPAEKPHWPRAEHMESLPGHLCGSSWALSLALLEFLLPLYHFQHWCS